MKSNSSKLIGSRSIAQIQVERDQEEREVNKACNIQALLLVIGGVLFLLSLISF